MIRMAIVTGVFVAAGYIFLMNSVMSVALDQTQQLTQQYQRASALADQIAAGSSSTQP